MQPNKFNNILKYFLITASVLVVAIFVFIFSGLTFLSYFVLDSMSGKQLSEESSQTVITQKNSQREITINNKTIKFNDLDKKLEEITSVKRLKDSIKNEPKPSLCEIICDSGQFATYNEDSKSTDKLFGYYNRKGADALKDPQFRITLDHVAIVAEIFPESIIELIKDINDFTAKETKMTEVDKIWLSSKITATFMSEVAMMNENIKKNSAYSKALKQIVELRKQCGVKSTEKIKLSCDEILQ